MVNRVRVYPYKKGSRSAKALAESLGGKVLRRENSKYRQKAGDLVVNWGASDFSNKFNEVGTVLNKDTSVAACKLKTFEALDDSGVNIPDYATSRQDAEELLGFPVVCRTVLQGHSGAGIVIADNAEELVDAPLYTKYVKKMDEYRVHVMRGGAFFIQRKAKRNDVEDPDWRVRNLAGGFVFVEVPLKEAVDRFDHRWECPGEVIDEAVDAVAALGLDFGGVDVIWNHREQKAYVLEVNTACGLEDRTAERYRDAILSIL